MRKFSWLALALLVVLSGCSKNYMAERAYYKAEKIYDAVDREVAEQVGIEAYSEAISAFEHVIEKYPGTPKAKDSLFLLSELYHSQGEYEKSRDNLRSIIVNYSTSQQSAAEARYRIAKSYEAEENWGQAEHYFWEITEYHPLHNRGLQAPIQVIMHYAAMGYDDAKTRVYKKAIETYERLLDDVGPIEASTRISNYLAVAHTTMGYWDEARNVFLSIINDFPESPAAPLALLAAAEAAQKNGQDDVALADYKTFVQDYPNHEMTGQIYTRLGLLSHQANNYAEARKYYEEAESRFTGKTGQIADIKLLVARTYQAEGDWEKAKAHYEALKNDYPQTVAALQTPLQISAYHKSKGDEEKAMEVLDEAIKDYTAIMNKYPGTNIANFAGQLINDAYSRKGEWDKILNKFDEAITEATTSEDKGKLLLMKALTADEKAKDKELALKLYNQFLTQHADHPLVDTARTRRDLLSRTAAQ